MADGRTRSWFSVEAGGVTWLFDLTFLASTWHCIFGRGCEGILDRPAPERGEGCCSHGAHLVDDDDRERVAAAAARLTPAGWHNHGLADAALFVDDGDEVTTALVDGVCVFHNPPGFAGGHGCALHLAASRAGDRPLDWKPDVCWQLPLRLDEHVDDNGHRTYILREWQRRDWGDGGTALHWWCTEDRRAFAGAEPVYRHLADEIETLVGPEPYAALIAHLDRPPATPLPHPARRSGRS